MFQSPRPDSREAERVSEYGNYPQQQEPGQYGGYPPQQGRSGGQPPQQGQYGGQLPQQGGQYGNYPQQQEWQPTGGTGFLGKRRNPFAVWLLLPIITLGIYGLVWIYKTNKEMAQFDPRIQVNPTMSVLAFFPGFLLIVPPFVAAWRLSSRVAQAQRAAGVPECSPVLAFILWMFVLNTGVLYLQFEINKIWDRYTGGVEGQQVPHFG
jgi:hypothetical protein